ncbi:MAG: CDP-2,3-bis-(O-geranylgeranyl)-sn-glycerol synthase [Candidatus Aenigmatarchaeota archaeon]
MDILFELIRGFWIIIPAYAANGFAPMANGHRRIDFGKKFFGKPLFGAGKTWEGLLFSVFIGTLCGLVQIYAHPYLNPMALEEGFSLQALSIYSVFFVALGAMLGDILGSFIKRRVGMKRGESLLLGDQLDFLLIGFLFASVFMEVSILSVLIFLIITPIIHRTACFLGYKLGLKREPW